jgi:hypothetical protein
MGSISEFAFLIALEGYGISEPEFVSNRLIKHVIASVTEISDRDMIDS